MSQKYSTPVYVHDVPWQLYDLLIAAGCLVSFWLACRWTPWALIPAVVLIYGSLIEPRLLTVKRFALGQGSRSIRIAFISDIHVGPYKGAGWVRRLVRKTHALKPDLVLLGGDFLYRDASALKELEPLKDLRAPLGVFAILGNHDEWKAHKESLDWFGRSGIPLLLNRSVRLEKDGAAFGVAGADDDWYGETELAAAFKDLRPDEPAVVMLHNPDLAPPAVELLKERKAPTVLFSGHAHGGQVRLPFIGPVPRIPHHLGRKYDRGLFFLRPHPRESGGPENAKKLLGSRLRGNDGGGGGNDGGGGGIHLVIGQGVGESGPRARLFCPPQIAFVVVYF